jgi:hypothetical protein
MSKFISTRWVEGSIAWLVEKKQFEAKQRGLCFYCYGVGRIHAKDSYIDIKESKPCDYCRATGRNLDLEYRDHTFHEERVSKLSFSQIIREYCQLKKKQYSINGFQPFTTDERIWLFEMESRLKYEFCIGSRGNKTDNMKYYQNLPFYDAVMFQWECRLRKKDAELFKYVWEKSK